jgi:hypothetical protein
MKSIVFVLIVAFSISCYAQENEQVFLSANKIKKGIITTASGLQYEIISKGTGQKPTLTNEVKVHYSGVNTAGIEFDSSYKRGEPITLPMNVILKGWQEGLQLMPTGSKYKFYIPSALAYGSKGVGTDIKPNETLIFEIELLEIIGVPNDASVVSADLHKSYTTAEIDKQMEANAKDLKLIEALANFNFMSGTSKNKTQLTGFGFENITVDYMDDLKNNPDDWTAVKIKHKKIAENYNDDIEENYKKWTLFLDNCKTISSDKIASGRKIIEDEKSIVVANRALINKVFIIEEETNTEKDVEKAVLAIIEDAKNDFQANIGKKTESLIFNSFDYTTSLSGLVFVEFVDNTLSFKSDEIIKINRKDEIELSKKIKQTLDLYMKNYVSEKQGIIHKYESTITLFDSSHKQIFRYTINDNGLLTRFIVPSSKPKGDEDLSKITKVFSLQKGDQLTYELKNEAGQVVTLVIVLEEIGNGQLKYNWKGLPPNPATGTVTISDNALKNASQYVNPFSGGKSPINLDNACAFMLSKVNFLELKNKRNTTLDLFSGRMNYTNMYAITPEILSIPAGNKEMHCTSGQNKFKVLDNPDYPVITEMQMGKMKVTLVKVQR